jgi:hypothetical protein
MTLVYFTFLICVIPSLFKYLDRYCDTNKATIWVFMLVTHIGTALVIYTEILAEG